MENLIWLIQEMKISLDVGLIDNEKSIISGYNINKGGINGIRIIDDPLTFLFFIY